MKSETLIFNSSGLKCTVKGSQSRNLGADETPKSSITLFIYLTKKVEKLNAVLSPSLLTYRFPGLISRSPATFCFWLQFVKSPCLSWWTI